MTPDGLYEKPDANSNPSIHYKIDLCTLKTQATCKTDKSPYILWKQHK